MYSYGRRSNWNNGCPFLTGVLGCTSTSVTRVGSGNLGTSWIVCWIIFASVASGVTKRKPIRNMTSRCTPTDAETMPQTMLNFIHLNLKNTSHTTSA